MDGKMTNPYQNKTFVLKVIQKEETGEGRCLGTSVNIERKSALHQWLTTKRDKGMTPFFLALCDEKDECIDAKYIPVEAVSRILMDWGIESDRDNQIVE